MNWELCCLCQLDKPHEALQTPKEEGLESLERDLKDFNAISADTRPPGINITISQLNDGSGIAESLKSHKARYHKTCRSYCSSSRVKRAREKLKKEADPQNSPKKLRSSSKFYPLDNAMSCVICEGEELTDVNLHKVVTDVVDANLKCWAKTNENFQLLGRLVAVAADAHAAETYYHQRRGNGPWTRVGNGSTRIPKREWNSGFLKNEENKRELFSFISTQISKTDMGGKLLLSTHYETVLSNRHCDLTTLQPSNHVEADTRIFLHLAHAAEQGHITAYIRTVDSDVVVLAVRFFETSGLSELWVGFGTGKKYRDIPVHTICSNLGPSKSLALPLFHSLTGCDTTSQILGCGKKTAWAAWTSLPDLTDTLVALTQDPDLFTLESIHMQQIERFVIIMYSKGCGAASVNEARHRLFTTGSRSLENIPPTQAALFQHVKRALLQASFYWNQATTVQQEIPDFSDWGWQKDGSNNWQPLWTTLSDASVACAILLHCGCKKACTGRCKCNCAGVRCTVLCQCGGGCTNNDGSDS